jgi:transcriptional regulator with XRE-family HTH domain
MEAAGFSSQRQLALAAGVSPTAIGSIVEGGADPRPGTRRKLAAALRISESELHKLITGTEERIEPWLPPAGSERLTPRQRKLATELILTFLEDNDAVRSTSAQKKTDQEASGPDQKNVVRLRPPKPDRAAARDDLDPRKR